MRERPAPEALPAIMAIRRRSRGISADERPLPRPLVEERLPLASMTNPLEERGTSKQKAARFGC